MVFAVYLVLASIPLHLPLPRASVPFAEATQASASALRTEHVVVLVLDGARFDHTFGDPSHQHVPRLWADLVPQGTMVYQFFNSGHTVTVSGHATLTTGRLQHILGEDLGEFADLTIFEALRQQRSLPKESTWLVLGKDKLVQVFTRSMSQRRFPPAIWGRETEDPQVAQELWNILASHHPILTVANFPTVDRSAHAGNWEAYLAGIRGFDAIAAETWRRIQTDPALAGKTTLFITQDHGRRYDDWKNHGDNSEGSRRIPFLALGPDVRANAISEVPRSLDDLGATLAWMLRVSLPQADGRVMMEIFTPERVQGNASLSSSAMDGPAATPATPAAAAPAPQAAGR